MRTLIAGLALALVACGGDSATGANTTPGTYLMRTLNGQALPYVIAQTGANKSELTDDAVTLNAGGTYTETGHVRNTTNGQVTTQSHVDAGSFTLNGTAITLLSTDGTSVSGTLNGSTLTVVEQGLSAVYTK